MRRLMFFVGGLICGALVAVAIVLLLTPESGSDMRDDAHNRVSSAAAEARLASEKRRQELETELAALTGNAAISK